jgi:hypothetical protein
MLCIASGRYSCEDKEDAGEVDYTAMPSEVVQGTVINEEQELEALFAKISASLEAGRITQEQAQEQRTDVMHALLDMDGIDTDVMHHPKTARFFEESDTALSAERKTVASSETRARVRLGETLQNLVLQMTARIITAEEACEQRISALHAFVDCDAAGSEPTTSETQFNSFDT